MCFNQLVFQTMFITEYRIYIVGKTEAGEQLAGSTSWKKTGKWKKSTTDYGTFNPHTYTEKKQNIFARCTSLHARFVRFDGKKFSKKIDRTCAQNMWIHVS